MNFLPSGICLYLSMATCWFTSRVDSSWWWVSKDCGILYTKLAFFSSVWAPTFSVIYLQMSTLNNERCIKWIVIMFLRNALILVY